MSHNSQQPQNVTTPGERQRWSDIELLPAWDEEYYDVYTAKKFGKWVMLKTLKPQYRDNPDFRRMIEKEFDVRYNLAHPNIVMINDFEEVPSLGMCIITDDVYGDSLRKLIEENRVTDKHIEQLKSRLPAAMEYIQHNHIAHHPIRPETIIFTEKIGNLKLIDVGFEQKKSLSHEDTNNDIENFGAIILEVLEKTGRHDPDLKRVAERCLGRAAKKPYRDVQSLRIAIEGRKNNSLYVIISIILLALAFVLAWMLPKA
ncbi:MAG: protein kinase [Muribaculaceae bacterium]|nr:protein kinase [Muribaculaceae bacterium]